VPFFMLRLSLLKYWKPLTFQGKPIIKTQKVLIFSFKFGSVCSSASDNPSSASDNPSSPRDNHLKQNITNYSRNPWIPGVFSFYVHKNGHFRGRAAEYNWRLGRRVGFKIAAAAFWRRCPYSALLFSPKHAKIKGE
jgi:hypothetical protein